MIDDLQPTPHADVGMGLTNATSNEPTVVPREGSPSMLTVKATAEQLGVSPSLVYGLCAAGKIRHERHGLGRGVIRIPTEALEEYRRAAAASAAKPKGEPLRLRHLTVD